MPTDVAIFEPMITLDEQKLENDRLFEKEFLPHADALYTFAYHLVYDEEDARDLVQDTFMKSYRFISSYEKGTNAKAWLFKILKNSFINDYRKKSRQPIHTDYEDVLAYADSDDDNKVGNVDLRNEIFQEMMGDEVTRAINELPVDFRTIILLCDIEEFSYEELAKILDIPVGTVRSRLHRARNLMKEKLVEYGKKMGYKEKR